MNQYKITGIVLEFEIKENGNIIYNEPEFEE